MNQLLKVVFLALFLSLFHHASAQRSFGTIVMGLESGFDVAQFSDGIRARMSPAIQAEFSVGRFSFGAGIGKIWNCALPAGVGAAPVPLPVEPELTGTGAIQFGKPATRSRTGSSRPCAAW